MRDEIDSGQCFIQFLSVTSMFLASLESEDNIKERGQVIFDDVMDAVRGNKEDSYKFTAGDLELLAEGMVRRLAKRFPNAVQQ